MLALGSHFRMDSFHKVVCYVVCIPVICSMLGVVNQVEGRHQLSKSGPYRSVKAEGGRHLDGRRRDVSSSLILNNRLNFEREEYHVNVAENVYEGPASPILQVRATATDPGSSNQIVYTLVSPTNRFSITSDTGEISLLIPLDYEVVSTYQLQVQAQDQDPHSEPAYTRVVVYVLDTNDNSPSISINAMTSDNQLSLIENEVVLVAMVTVEDPDAGSNGEVECYVDDERFSLRNLYQNMYLLSSATLFDREANEVVDIVVRCQDNGMPPLQTSISETVHIVDINDNVPMFSTSLYTASIKEDIMIQTTVLQVSAIDMDKGQNADIRYYLQDNLNNILQVDPITGTVTTNIRLDYEQMNRFDFLVLAVDQGVPPMTGTATISVEVMDVNDNLPVFSHETYIFAIYSTEPAGTAVGTVLAMDYDAPPYDQFVFSMEDSTNMFDIDSVSGLISTKNAFNQDSPSVFHLVVKATDLSLKCQSSSATVTVYVHGMENDSVLK